MLRHLSIPGVTLAIMALWIALSPSLLPRAWWVTAANVGVSLAYGYLLGSLLGRFASLLSRRTDLRIELNGRSDWAFRTSWLVLLVVISGIVWVQSLHQQEQISLMAGVSRGGALNQFIGVVGGVVLFGLLVLLGRGLARLWRGVRRIMRKILPRYLAAGATTVIVALLVVFVSNQVLYQRALNWALGNATQLNQSVPEGAANRRNRSARAAPRHTRPGRPWGGMGSPSSPTVPGPPTSRPRPGRRRWSPSGSTPARAPTTPSMRRRLPRSPSWSAPAGWSVRW